MGKIENTEEWHKIGNKLCNFLGICSCQRKLKSIVDVLVRIHEKGTRTDETVHNYTAEEYLILALLDDKNLITHGVNCEYPIILHITKEEDFWEWVLKIKDSPYLEDN